MRLKGEYYRFFYVLNQLFFDCSNLFFRFVSSFSETGSFCLGISYSFFKFTASFLQFVNVFPLSVVFFFSSVSFFFESISIFSESGGIFLHFVIFFFRSVAFFFQFIPNNPETIITYSGPG
jgi:hypothetical protein